MIVTVARDITERKTQQEKIERLSRVHAMLSGINATIVRTRDRQELFGESCRIAHEAGGFSAVWIGLTDEESTLVEPVAWHGDPNSVERLRDAKFLLGSDREAGQTLLIEMMRTRTPAITNDAGGDSRVGHRELMAELGINSAAFLPLIVADQVTGVMAMYSPLRGHFDEAEVKLLSELAADISFALEHLQKIERAAWLALHDELTGLANRRLLIERAAQLIRRPGSGHGKFALALLDL